MLDEVAALQCVKWTGLNYMPQNSFHCMFPGSRGHFLYVRFGEQKPSSSHAEDEVVVGGLGGGGMLCFLASAYCHLPIYLLDCVVGAGNSQPCTLSWVFLWLL